MLGHIRLQRDPGRWPQEDMKSYTEFKRLLEERVYVDTSSFFGYTLPIRAALEEFPATQLLFGTDYSWELCSGDELHEFVNAILASGNRQDANRFLGENALDLLVNTS